MSRVAHALVTLLLAACCGYLLWRDSYRPGFGRLAPPTSERLSASADPAVRVFLGANWLGGDYELPADEKHCAVVLLRFEDGKLRGRERATTFSPKPGGSRVVPFFVMWGPGPKGTRVVDGWPGFSSAADDNPAFADLYGGLARSYGDVALGEIRGYRVVGYAMSRQPRAGREQHKNQSGDVDFAVQNRQAVLVLGVKPFATAEEAKDWIDNGREPPD